MRGITTAHAATLGAIITAGALLLATQTAAAGTIHACVKPRSGATRIVANKAKCRHGEQRLSWNTTGPRGPAGADGANGAAGAEGKAGADGTGVLYSASDSEDVKLPSGATTVVKKILPPGSYLAMAKTTMAADGTKAETTESICELADQAGTTGSGESQVLDLVGWEEQLAEKAPNEFGAESPFVLQGPLTSSVTSTLSVICVHIEGAVPSADITQLDALSVSSVL